MNLQTSTQSSHRLHRWLNNAFPERALKRSQARFALRQFEAAMPSRFHPSAPQPTSANHDVLQAGKSLRQQARSLEQNYDLVQGVLDTLVANVVGVAVRIEPQVKCLDGTLALKVNARLQQLFQRWQTEMDEQGTETWQTWCRLVCRTWLRDGEVFIRLLVPKVSGGMAFQTPQVALTLQALEAESVPQNLTEVERHLIQGVQLDRGNRVQGYRLGKKPFAEEGGAGACNELGWHDTVFVPKEDCLHLKLNQRVHQLRGVSVLASSLRRLYDLKDYESSEQIAARTSACMTGYVKKPLSSVAAFQNTQEDRRFPMKAGMFFDNLSPGEELNVINSQRPNALLPEFRNAMLKAVAAGTGTGYSSIARDYQGSYSSQRQALVEQAQHYAVLRDRFIQKAIRPIWERFVSMANLQDLMRDALSDYPTLDVESLTDADFRGPSTPWIDPLKEVKADETAIQAGLKSRSQVIRERGGNPLDVRNQIFHEREADVEQELQFSSTFNDAQSNAAEFNEASEEENAAKTSNLNTNTTPKD